MLYFTGRNLVEWSTFHNVLNREQTQT